MTSLTCTSTGQSIALTQQIASSGEGAVWQTNLNGYLAKIYHAPRPERIRKLEVMVANPPQDPNARINHVSFAWPKSLLQDAGGNSVGFLMPAIANSIELLDVCNPRRRQKILPGFNWFYLHTAALNVASIVRAIHTKGYVLGDIKLQNILISNQALPAVIDTDSFQVRHPQTGEIFRCPVGSEGFTPVELLGKDLAIVEQTEVHDRFRLAVVIHLLLFGDHPFKGKWLGEGDSPEPTELLRQGFWPYAPRSPIQAGPLTIPLNTVHPAIQNYFLRCFNAGHTQPELRPTALEWYEALKVAISELKACRKVKRHYYSQTYGHCYWCDRKTILGVDIFSASNPPKKRIQRKVKIPSEALKKQIIKRIPASLSYPVSNLVQRSRITTATRKYANLNYASPTSATLMAAPSYTPLALWKSGKNLTTGIDQLLHAHYRRIFLGIGIGVGSVSILLALLVLLSNSKMNQDDIGLTITGIVLLLGLIAVCFLLTKIIEKSNS